MTIKNAAILAFCALASGTLGASRARAEFVTNGGFCTGGAACAPNGDSNGWTTTSSGDPYYTNTINLATGLYAAQIGAYYPDEGNDIVQGSISQTLATVAGQEYSITFQYGEYNGNPSLSANNPFNPNDPSNPTLCSSNGCYLDSGNVTNSNNPSPDHPWAQNNNLNVLWGNSSVYSDSNFFTSAISGPNNTDGGTSIGDFILGEQTIDVFATGTSTTLEFDADDVQQGVIVTGVDVEVVTPEPGTMGLLGSALLGLGLLARRRGFARGVNR